MLWGSINKWVHTEGSVYRWPGSIQRGLLLKNRGVCMGRVCMGFPCFLHKGFIHRGVYTEGAVFEKQRGLFLKNRGVCMGRALLIQRGLYTEGSVWYFFALLHQKRGSYIGVCMGRAVLTNYAILVKINIS